MPTKPKKQNPNSMEIMAYQKISDVRREVI